MSKHTPGPWEVSADGYAPRGVVGNRNGTPASIVSSLYDETNEPTLEELDANAALIAAAPDLLAALAAVVEWSNRAESERQQSGPILRDYLAHAAETARAAIAKARGEVVSS